MEPAEQATPVALGAEQPTDPFARPRPRRRVDRRVAIASVAAVAVLAAGGTTAALLAHSGNNTPMTLAAQHPTPTVSATTPSATLTPLTTLPAVIGSIKDSKSGEGYSRLAAPWANGCPSDLSSPQAITWTGGESAPDAQVTASGHSREWSGEACSGLVPAHYGYKGVPTLASVAQKLATAFAAAYYSGPSHTFTQLASAAHPVSGRHGWEVTYRLDYQGAGLPFTSEEAAVVVIDRGSGLPPAVFFASVPSNLAPAEVNALVSSLSLTLPKSPHPSASASTTAAGTGNNNGNTNPPATNPPVYPTTNPPANPTTNPPNPPPTTNPNPPPSSCSSNCGGQTSPPPTF
jgi:hypothetical protein